MFKILIFVLITSRVNAKYTPDWESLDSRPLPDWYDKVGTTLFVLDENIFIRLFLIHIENDTLVVVMIVKFSKTIILFSLNS